MIIETIADQEKVWYDGHKMKSQVSFNVSMMMRSAEVMPSALGCWGEIGV
jgi:hypothetical protein